MGDLYVAEGKRIDAEASYRLAHATEENPFSRLKLGVMLIEDGNSAAAAAQIDSALAPDVERRGTLTPQQSANAWYLLGIAYRNTGRVDQARQSVARALAINPNLAPARTLRQQLGQ